MKIPFSGWYTIAMVLSYSTAGCGGGLASSLSRCEARPDITCGSTVEYAAERDPDAARASWGRIVRKMATDCARLQNSSGVGPGVAVPDPSIDPTDAAFSCLQVAALRLGAAGVSAGRISSAASRLDPEAIPVDWEGGETILEFLCGAEESSHEQTDSQAVETYESVRATGAADEACLMLGDIAWQSGEQDAAAPFYERSCARGYVGRPDLVQSCIENGPGRSESRWFAAGVRLAAARAWIGASSSGAEPNARRRPLARAVAVLTDVATPEATQLRADAERRLAELPPPSPEEIAAAPTSSTPASAVASAAAASRVRPAEWEAIAPPRRVGGEESLQLAGARGVLVAQIVIGDVRSRDARTELYVSTEGGSSWSRVPDGPHTGGGSCLGTAQAVIYVGCGPVFRTTDGVRFEPVELPATGNGAWQVIEALGNMALAYSPSGIAILEGDATRWARRTLPRRLPNTQFTIASGINAIVVRVALDQENLGTFVSNDAGRSWLRRKDLDGFDYPIGNADVLLFGDNEDPMHRGVDDRPSALSITADRFRGTEHIVTGQGDVLWMSDPNVHVSGDGGRSWWPTRVSDGGGLVHAVARANPWMVIAYRPTGREAEYSLFRTRFTEGQRVFGEARAARPLERRVRVALPTEVSGDCRDTRRLTWLLDRQLSRSWRVALVPAESGLPALAVTCRFAADVYTVQAAVRRPDGTSIASAEASGSARELAAITERVAETLMATLAP